MKASEGITVQNKWNSKLYKVVKLQGSKVVLGRNDGTCFEIALSEFYFSYRETK